MKIKIWARKAGMQGIAEGWDLFFEGEANKEAMRGKLINALADGYRKFQIMSAKKELWTSEISRDVTQRYNFWEIYNYV